MKKFLAYLRISLTDTLEYRGDVFLFTISGVALPLTGLLLWIAVSATGSSSPLSQLEFVRYYLFLLFVGLWVSNWASYFMSRDIRLGYISPWLVRPASFIAYQAGNNLSEKILKTAFLIPILILLALVFDFSFPVLSISRWALFFLTLILAAVIAFVIDICLGLLAFWLDDSAAVRELYAILYLIFSGRFMPLYVFPLFIQNIAVFLPFRYTLSLPLEIIVNKLSDRQLFQAVIIQLLFLGVAICCYKFLWVRGLKRYSASGH